ncbi:proline racemase family protein [Salinisphaera sp. LB1]|uniref:proline racemase family protein n=1 Tax=Salinisphaera sp. LB1 TaxID=2183911 RepID=UPI000D708761|nr:proline racemase family protein [Salinisphaera sp. LB1]AWN16431.1 2-methylaconitate racemase [Salinisphaera sp. LB1]
MSRQYALRLMDTHAGGDVSRIVTGGVPDLPGDTVRAQMVYLRDEADDLRRLLLEEPYGIPEMSVDLLVPPSDSRAVAGYIIMEVMGYPIYSGSNTICTATAVLESGIVEKVEGIQHFTLEAPAGLVEIEARVKDGVVEAITCQGLPSYIDTYDARIDVPGIGEITYHVVYSGGFYALVDATELGFELVAPEERRLAEAAHTIVEAIRTDRVFSHYSLGDVGPLPFLHFMGPVDNPARGFYRSRSATYVHPGVICRSTTGTGTSARLALMNHRGEIEPGDRLETVSLRNTRFVGEFVARDHAEGHDVVRNTITGRAHVIAESEIIANADDPMIEHLTLNHVVETRA